MSTILQKPLDTRTEALHPTEIPAKVASGISDHPLQQEIPFIPYLVDFCYSVQASNFAKYPCFQGVT